MLRHLHPSLLLSLPFSLLRLSTIWSTCPRARCTRVLLRTRSQALTCEPCAQEHAKRWRRLFETSEAFKGWVLRCLLPRLQTCSAACVRASYVGFHTQYSTCVCNIRHGTGRDSDEPVLKGAAAHEAAAEDAFVKSLQHYYASGDVPPYSSAQYLA